MSDRINDELFIINLATVPAEGILFPHLLQAVKRYKPFGKTTNLMRVYDNKRIRIIIFSIISGLAFATYLLYEQRGTIGQTEIIALTLTAILAIVISIIIIRKGNK